MSALLECVSAPVTVTGYRQYTDRKTGQPSTRRDGSPVEAVQYRVPGDSEVRELPLAATVNGQRVDAGTECRLIFDQLTEAVTRRDVSFTWVANKYRVTGFASAK